MATIAIANIGLDGHLGPATRLGATLVRQGHHVLAFAPPSWRDKSAAAGLEFHPHTIPVRPIRGPVEFAAALAEAADDFCEELIDELFRQGADLVIHDSMAPWGRIAAEFLGLPRIVSHPLFPGRGPPPGAADGAREDMREDAEGAAQRVGACRSSIARRWGVELGDWQATVSNAGELTVIFTTETILGPVELQAGWRPVGPLMDPPQRRLPPRGRRLIYTAFGTYSNTRTQAFRVVADALADEQLDVLISTGGGTIAPSDLGPLPANVVVRGYVDSRRVLGRASVHITHGGAGSVHESMLAGVPMVCTPQDVDQLAWSERVASLGAGEIVDPTPTAIRSAVRRLLDDPRVSRRAHALAAHLAAYDGAGRVAAVIREALG